MKCLVLLVVCKLTVKLAYAIAKSLPKVLIEFAHLIYFEKEKNPINGEYILKKQGWMFSKSWIENWDETKNKSNIDLEKFL